MNLIKDLFSKNYRIILFVYLLFIFESALILIYPLILGNTIDSFVNKEYSYILYLILVLGSFITSSYYRRIYDTRVYSTLYRKLILKYINIEIDKKTNTSTINARTNMLHSFVDFIEVDLPYIFYAVFSIVGSILIIMFSYNFNIGLIVLFSLIPILFISKYFKDKLSVKYAESNDLSEKDIDELESKDKTKIKHHYLLKNLLSIKISNIDASNTMFNYIVNYSLIIIVLLVFSITDIPTIGAVMALYQYVLKFTDGAMMIPNLLLRYEYLKDVIKRIEE